LLGSKIQRQSNQASLIGNIGVPVVVEIAFGRTSIDASTEADQVLASGNLLDSAKKLRAVQQKFRGEISRAIDRPQFDAGFAIHHTVL